MWPLAKEIFETLATCFPVCMSSDEFHYFPQYKSDRFCWSRWDDFSVPALSDLQVKMVAWEKALAGEAAGAPLSDRVIEAKMLARIVHTLHEQLTLVRFQETQPTFFLTIAGIGLAEAIEDGPRSLAERVQSLPGFLRQAARNLACIPPLFRDLGLDMLPKQRRWIASLALPTAIHTALQAAYARLETAIHQAVDPAAIPLPASLYERIARGHMGCQRSLEEIAEELDREIEETRAMLVQSAGVIAPGRPWQAVVDSLAPPQPPPGGAIRAYDAVIAKLAEHCVQQKIVEPDFLQSCPVTVAPIPNYMRPVRSNAAYSMPPAHPPRGGTFYILESQGRRVLSVDYRLLAAHETYPGHHVLDAWRWRHPRPVRRHIEFPIFYEGWASFAEELLFDTGFFSGPADRMIMAKRRFWRAMRGKADLDMHTGRHTLDEAAAHLAADGIPSQRARAMVKRYRLKPGYQLAYTMGRRHFRWLYERWRHQGRHPTAFASRVFAQGEIELNDLEQVLQ